MCRVVYLLLLVAATSCVSPEKILYLQPLEDGATTQINKQDITFKAGDEVSFTAINQNMNAVAIFNRANASSNIVTKGSAPLNSSTGGDNNSNIYTINKDGFIKIPVIGKVNILGLTKIQAEDKIASKIDKLTPNTEVDLNIVNFRITVLGDVVAPGTYPIPSGGVTIFEALGKSGDLNITADRSSVKILRDSLGFQTTKVIDLTKSDVLSSNYFNLQQNDVIYVAPNDTKVQSAGFFTTATLISALIAFTSSIIVLVLVQR